MVDKLGDDMESELPSGAKEVLYPIVRRTHTSLFQLFRRHQSVLLKISSYPVAAVCQSDDLEATGIVKCMYVEKFLSVPVEQLRRRTPRL